MNYFQINNQLLHLIKKNYMMTLKKNEKFISHQELLLSTILYLKIGFKSIRTINLDAKLNINKRSN